MLSPLAKVPGLWVLPTPFSVGSKISLRVGGGAAEGVSLEPHSVDREKAD